MELEERRTVEMSSPAQPSFVLHLINAGKPGRGRIPGRHPRLYISFVQVRGHFISYAEIPRGLRLQLSRLQSGLP